MIYLKVFGEAWKKEEYYQLEKIDSVNSYIDISISNRKRLQSYLSRYIIKTRKEPYEGILYLEIELPEFKFRGEWNGEEKEGEYIDIYEMKDEYFIVLIWEKIRIKGGLRISPHPLMSRNIKKYKCDQIDGVIELLENSKIINNESDIH